MTQFRRTRLADGTWTTTPRLAVMAPLEHDPAYDAPVECADHAWPETLLPETTCAACGLRFADWSEIDS